MKTIAIITARMTSSRFPGKVLAPISDKPSLQYMIERLRNTENLDGIMIASTTNDEDIPIHNIAKSIGIPSYAGSEHDVLGRLLQAAESIAADIIVYLTGDCPLIDPKVVDRVIDKFKATEADFASNTLRRSYVRGMDCEVFSTTVLQQLEQELVSDWDREHVTEYIYLRPQRFKIVQHETSIHEERLPLAQVCFDNQEDYDLLKILTRELSVQNENFGALEIASFLRKNPAICDINSSTRKKRYRVGISGLGRVSWSDNEVDGDTPFWTHTAALDLMPDAELVAAFDPDQQKATKFNQSCPHVVLYNSLSDMLAQSNIDILYICSPTEHHAEDLEQALNSDISAVVCEKPLDTVPERATSLVKGFQQKGISLFVNYWPRWSDLFIKVKRIIDNRQLGNIKSVTYHYSQGLFNSGSYGVDILHALFGEVRSVQALSKTTTGRKSDDGISALLNFKNNINAFLIALDGRKHLTTELDIIGDNGRVRLIDNGHTFELWQPEKTNHIGGPRNILKCKKRQSDHNISAFPMLSQNVVNHLRFGRPILCDGFDGAKAVIVCHAIYQSFQDQCRIVNTEENDS